MCRTVGILIFNRPLDRSKIELEPPPPDWWLKAFKASILRWQFDVHGGDRSWFDLFQEAQASAPVGNFRMSELSRLLLASCFDYDAIRHRRRANYDSLVADLGDLALFPDAPVCRRTAGVPDSRQRARSDQGEPLFR